MDQTIVGGYNMDQTIVGGYNMDQLVVIIWTRLLLWL